MHKAVRKNTNLAASLRELAELGSPVDLSVADPEDEEVEVEIHQIGGVHDSGAFELPGGLTGYALDLEIINQTSRKIYCSHVELSLPWQDDYFGWLPDPRENGRVDVYYFSRRHGLEFPRDLVLNHVLLEDGLLAPRRPLRGLLLPRGGSMPKSVHHGQWLKATLAIFASDHNEHTAELCLWTDRPKVKQNAPMGRSNLFERDMRPGAGLYGPNKNSIPEAAAFFRNGEEQDHKRQRKDSEN